MIRLCIFSLLVIALCWMTSTTKAQMLPIENAGLNTAASNAHARPAIPNGWKSDDPELIRVWRGPDESWNSLAIGGGAKVYQDVQLPALTEKQAKHSQWDLVVAVDVLGKFTPSETAGTLSVALNQTTSGKSAKKIDVMVENRAAKSYRADWKIRASSAERKAREFARNAFDRDPKTFWHSRYTGRAGKLPQFLSVDFGKQRTLKGIRYLPRPNGTNGNVKDFEIHTSQDGQKWQKQDQGSFDYPSNGVDYLKHAFAKPVTTRHLRFVAKSEVSGQSFASCSELEFIWDDAKNESPIGKRTRHFLVVPADRLPADGKVTIELKVDSMRYVVCDHVYVFALPKSPSRKLFGKANGGLGPDGMGAGCYGLEAYTVHQQPALPIIQVTPGSPAAVAGLKLGDTIVGINGQWLPPNDLAPGWNWFERSHESLLGQAAILAMSKPANEGALTLQVLRNGKVSDFPISLKLPISIHSKSYLLEPSKNGSLRNQLIAHVVKHQAKDGSWNRDPKRTALGGLALLSTRDQKYAKQIKSAANWLLSHHADPSTGFFWHPAYAGIFLAEYHLATGDARVLPWMERHLNHVAASYHTSKWGTKTLGHGPRGLPYGNKSLVAPMVHVLLFEALAKRCGIQSSIWESVEPFVESAWSDPAKGGHGGLGYNASYKDQNEFWSRSGLLALTLNLRGQRLDMQQGLVSMMQRRHPWLRNSHAYGEPGGGLGLIALAQVDRAAFRRILPQYAWWFALSWQDRYGLKYTTPHMGAPYMESDSLINNLYAIVLNAQNETLHLTGASDQNWLDVSNIQVPLTPVRFLLNDKGRLELHPRIPGPTIRYTTDGSEPNRNSAKYTRPISVSPGQTIKARTFNAANQSQVTTRSMALATDAWKIISASGKSNAEEAIRHAKNAIDGDPFIPWITESGEGATAFPHSLMIDLGKAETFSRMSLRFPLEGMAASQVSVSIANSKREFEQIKLEKLEKFGGQVSIALGSQSSRFIKIEFLQPRSENQKSLMLGELELFND